MANKSKPNNSRLAATSAAPPDSPPPVESSNGALTVQRKFAVARKEMGDALIERRGEVDVVLTGLICQEHPLLVGPPGTGKSLLLDSLLAWTGTAKRFTCLFSKFSTPEEVFGPISVAGLKADQYRRVTTDKLPEAHFAFLDEIFKASSAILNTMLRILNERTYENGDGTMRLCPLRLCVAASNEFPTDDGGKELGALFDRFLLRKKVHLERGGASPCFPRRGGRDEGRRARFRSGPGAVPVACLESGVPSPGAGKDHRSGQVRRGSHDVPVHEELARRVQR
jgi:MoxR domain in the MoxR-vWA-beta-propeller ternary systems